MNFKGHFAGAVVTSAIVSGVGVALHLPPLQILGVSFLPIVGGLYPDMDIKSRSSILVTLGILILSSIMFFMGNYLALTLIAAAGILPNLFPHRGPTHTYWFGGLVSLIPLYIGYRYFSVDKFYDMIYISGSFLVGYCSHLVLDGIFPWGRS